MFVRNKTQNTPVEQKNNTKLIMTTQNISDNTEINIKSRAVFIKHKRYHQIENKHKTCVVSLKIHLET